MFFSEEKHWFDKYIKCVVHICGAHNMNSMKRFFNRHRYVDGQEYDSNSKIVLMTVFCRILTCKNYETVKFLFEKACILTNNKCKFIKSKSLLVQGKSNSIVSKLL